MPTIGGMTIEQQVITVANDDTSINDAIAEQSEEGWMVGSLTLSGANMTILFTRTIAAEA